MVCERCGCRMVAKTSTGALVCVDCGHPADLRALQDGARRSWSAALALIGFMLFAGLVLAFAVLQDLRKEELQSEPAVSGKLE